MGLVGIAVVAVFAIGCGGLTTTPTVAPSAQPTSSSPGPSATPSAAPALILRVTTEGGFIGPTATIAAQPVVSVYADGRIVTPAPMDAIAPAPFPTSLSVRDLGPDRVTAIVAAIRSAGLDAVPTSSPGIQADTGFTVFDVVLDGQRITSRFAGGGPGRPGGDPTVQAANDLLGRLLDPADGWGGSAPQEQTVPATAFRVFEAPGAPAGDGGPAVPAVAWPLSTPLATFGTPAVLDAGVPGLRSGVVFGADAATLLTFLRQVNVATPLSSGGQTYTLWERPLLPDELGG